MSTSSTPPLPPQSLTTQVDDGLRYRIGTVSRLSGVPVPTLRVWEIRYGAFSPAKTGGKHRLYGDEDVIKANLLKLLTANGHSIGTIANLNVGQLRSLQQKLGVAPAYYQNASGTTAQPTRVVVVGVGLATRLESKKFTLAFQRKGPLDTQVFGSLTEARTAGGAHGAGAVLLVKASTLTDLLADELRQTRHSGGFDRCVVLYNYGSAAQVQMLQAEGVVLKREPVTDIELAAAMEAPYAAPPTALPLAATDGQTVAPRRYSDELLQQVGNHAQTVACECPRHVVELIGQLCSFEEYSAQCLSQSPQDAAVHAHLKHVAGVARTLFEDALERVAKHEGIDLTLRQPD